MTGSLLLHALSLNDRVLEPNRLPIAGRVWAYSKEGCSREMFVGNCISLLSLLGVDNARINWKDDIMAFDVSFQAKPATVIISLRDDSLASEYFYFLGIWICPQSDAPERAGHIAMIDTIYPGEDEELLKPVLSYGVTVWDRPLQLSEIRKLIRSEVLGQRMYQDSFYLCGQTAVESIPTGRFVICPTTPAMQHGRFEIRHALYSLRNLMALMGWSMHRYELLQKDKAPVNLYRQLMDLLSHVQQKDIRTEQWDDLVSEHARIALQGASDAMVYAGYQHEMRGVGRLFDAIVGELDVSDMKGAGSLLTRLRIPFQHLGDELEEHVNMIGRTEKQARIIQPFMHSRMLAGQQVLLQKIIENTEKGVSKQ